MLARAGAPIGSDRPGVVCYSQYSARASVMGSLMPFKIENLAGLGRLVRLCGQPRHLRRTSTIAIVVGSWLTLFNQGEVLWAGQVSFALLLKVFLNYLTPFAVANLGLLSSVKKDEPVVPTRSESPQPAEDEREDR